MFNRPSNAGRELRSLGFRAIRRGALSRFAQVKIKKLF
jgi:hypothetical protein